MEHDLLSLFNSSKNVTYLRVKLSISEADTKRLMKKWIEKNISTFVDAYYLDIYSSLGYINNKFIDYANTVTTRTVTTTVGFFPKFFIQSDDGLTKDETSLEDLRGLNTDKKVVVYAGSTEREGKFNGHKFPISQRNSGLQRLFAATEEGLDVHRQLETPIYGYNMSNIGKHKK